MVKTHRSTQLFLYSSGDERSVKCVRPALKMEASEEEQRGVFGFLTAENVGTHRHISAVYGGQCMSLTSVHEWQKRFRKGRTSLQDDSRPGQDHRAIMPDVVARIDGLIRENRPITEQQIRVQVGRGSARVRRLWIHQRPTSFYNTGIGHLVSQWDKYINTSGNYF